jgi:hypothetical protein
MKILLLSSVLISFSSLSADINFNWLQSTSGQKSALSGTCNYVDSSNDMDCNLRQLSVRKKLSIEDGKKNVNEAILEVDSELKNKTIGEYVKEELGSTCEQIPLGDEELKSLGNDRSAYDAIVDICNVPTREKLIKLMSSSVENDIKTCKVYEYDTGDFLFNQVNDNKWVSTNKPTGQCGAVTILTLERDPKHNSLWNYSQIRHYTNTESELCKSLSEMNEAMSYSWNGKSSLKMGCEYIEFGM